MKRHGIRTSGLLLTATVVRSSIEELARLLRGRTWLISGSMASQIWAYFLTGTTVFCRPTDNINVIGVDIMEPIEEAYGVLSEGFSSDDRRELNFFVSYKPRFRMNVISYSSPAFIDGLERVKKLRIWSTEVPVASMEDLIIRKLIVGRDEDGVDIVNMLRAYRRYLRASIVKENEPEQYLKFSDIIRIAEEEYPDLVEEIEERFKEFTSIRLDALAAVENNVRELVRELAV